MRQINAQKYAFSEFYTNPPISDGNILFRIFWKIHTKANFMSLIRICKKKKFQKCSRETLDKVEMPSEQILVTILQLK